MVYPIATPNRLIYWMRPHNLTFFPPETQREWHDMMPIRGKDLMVRDLACCFAFVDS